MVSYHKPIVYYNSTTILRRPYKKRRQRGGFLNRYDFAYAGKDTANQFGKIAPGTIKDSSSQINNLAQQRINQVISEGGKELESTSQNTSWSNRRRLSDTIQTITKL